MKNPRTRSTSPGACFICNKTGHRARDCSKNVARQRAKKIVCYSCGNEGHYSTNCPTAALQKKSILKKDVKFEKCDFCQKNHATTECPKVAQLSALTLQQSELLSEASEGFIENLNETGLEETS